MNVTKPFVPHFLTNVVLLYFGQTSMGLWSMGASSEGSWDWGRGGAGRGADEEPSQDKPNRQQANSQTIAVQTCSAVRSPSFLPSMSQGKKGEARIQSSRTVHPSMAGMPRLSPPFPAAAVTAVSL